MCLFLLLPGSFNFKVIPSVTTVRQLTQAQTSEALRPFLFAVHPDFFGKYPKERVGTGVVKDESDMFLGAHSILFLCVIQRMHYTVAWCVITVVVHDKTLSFVRQSFI